MARSSLVRDLARRADEDTMRRLVDAARAGALADEDVADLARTLAASGARLPTHGRAADVASTGGPSSLSTLLCQLQLRARGLVVPKLAVPGRPAGGVDVLQTVPGFQAALEPAAAELALRDSGCIHLLADARWTPLDAQLFAYRQREGAQTVPALVIASILAKKVAVGAIGAGLEVRVAPHANFGAGIEEARRNARRYNAVARHLDMRPVCALTDATRPYQPYIGRGEALIAVADVVAGRAAGWLADHAQLCQRIADAVADAMGADVAGPLEASALREAHELLLLAHGSSPSAFAERVGVIRAAPRVISHAQHPGVVGYDLARLRELLVDRQRACPASVGTSPPDPAGVVLEAPAGTRLETGQVVMSVRVPAGEERLARELASCARIEPGVGAGAPAPSTLEIIDA